LATGGKDAKTILWDLPYWKNFSTPIRHAILDGGGEVWALAFSAKDAYSQQLLAVGDAKAVTVWAVYEHVSQWEFEAGNQRPYPPKRESVLTGHQDTVRSVAFAPRGWLLASSGNDKDAMLWDVEDVDVPQRLTTLTEHLDQVSSVMFSADGRLLATASADGTAILYTIQAVAFP
jgi:WD40 repeat protein